MTPLNGAHVSPAVEIGKALTSGVLKVQPVAPTRTSAELWGWWLAIPTVLFGSPWLLMLALGAAHDLWPVVPAPGYWSVFVMLLGLRVVVGTARRPAWKWARS